MLAAPPACGAQPGTHPRPSPCWPCCTQSPRRCQTGGRRGRPGWGPAKGCFGGGRGRWAAAARRAWGRWAVVAAPAAAGAAPRRAAGPARVPSSCRAVHGGPATPGRPRNPNLRSPGPAGMRRPSRPPAPAAGNWRRHGSCRGAGTPQNARPGRSGHPPACGRRPSPRCGTGRTAGAVRRRLRGPGGEEGAAGAGGPPGGALPPRRGRGAPRAPALRGHLGLEDLLAGGQVPSGGVREGGHLVVRLGERRRGEP
jgi:hypothetical protein